MIFFNGKKTHSFLNGAKTKFMFNKGTDEPDVPDVPDIPDEPTPDEPTYTVSGVWVLNDSLSLPLLLTISQSVAFTSNGEVFGSILSTGRKLYYGGKEVYDVGTQKWVNDAYKTVDFYATEQKVGEEFYEIWTENAKKQEEEPTPDEPTYTVSGVWVFNDTITLNFSSDYTYQSVSFTSNNESFIDFEIGSFPFENKKTGQRDYVTNGIVYGTSGTSGIKVNENYHWLSSAYKTVDFGSTPQEVSQEFYEWLTKNAKKKHKVTWHLAYCSTTATIPEYMSEDEIFTATFTRDSNTVSWISAIYYTEGDVDVDITSGDKSSRSITLEVSNVKSDCRIDILGYISGSEPV